MKDLRLGDQVRLMSGGPVMTVCRPPCEEHPDTAGCVWFNGKEQCRDAFPVAGLVAGVRMVMPE